MEQTGKAGTKLYEHNCKTKVHNAKITLIYKSGK